MKNWLIWKDPDSGKDWRQKEKGTTEDEIVGWHHRLNGHEFWVNSGSWWWTGRPGVLQSMGSQRVGHKQSDWTELNWRSRVLTYYPGIIYNDQIKFIPGTQVQYLKINPCNLLYDQAKEKKITKSYQLMQKNHWTEFNACSL